MIRNSLFLLPLLLASTAAFAEIPDSIRTEIARLETSEPVFDVILEDLSMDDKLEALVILGEDCKQKECAWRVLADQDGVAVTVADFVGREVSIEITEGDGRVVMSDNVVWAFDGTQIFPFADALSSVVSKPALPREIDLIATTTRFTQTDEMRVNLYRLDLLGDAAEEKVFLIGGLYYAEGAWGTPYVIYGSDGNLIFEGASADYPRLFPSPDGSSLSIVDVVPAGYALSTLNAPEALQ